MYILYVFLCNFNLCVNAHTDSADQYEGDLQDHGAHGEDG